MVALCYLAIFFGLAVAADWLSITYHRHREARQVGPVVVVSVALAMLSWLPILVAIGGVLNAWGVAAADVAGSAVGSGWALYRIKRDEQQKDKA